ncbi:MAG TPA: HAD-IA family hydrolase [Candidatus Acidoferrales bacterium]|nr:HAD-IA family hydrolase [Candidatus Acidoferrales bacterium]
MVLEENRFADVRALIFDLDGTLIDSKLDLALSINAMLKRMSRAELQHEEIFGMVGNGAPVLVRRALGAETLKTASDEEADTGLAYFLSYYRNHMLDNTVTYPGVREGLALLEKHPMAVLTNKPVNFSRAILDGLGLSRYFRFVYGGNSFEKKKPHPMGVETLLRQLEAKPEEAMIVGDSEIDIQTARNSGIWSCGVTYGLGLEGLRAFPPDLMLDSLTELPAHLIHRSI